MTLTRVNRDTKQDISLEQHSKIGLGILHLLDILNVVSSTLHDSPAGAKKDDLDGLIEQAKTHINELKVRFNDYIFSNSGEQSFMEKVSVYHPRAFTQAIYRIREGDSERNLAAEYLHFLIPHLTGEEILKHLFCLNPRFSCPYLKDAFRGENTGSEKIINEILRLSRKM